MSLRNHNNFKFGHASIPVQLDYIYFTLLPQMTDIILDFGHEFDSFDLDYVIPLDTFEHKIMLGANLHTLNKPFTATQTPLQVLAFRNVFSEEQSSNICRKAQLLIQHGVDPTIKTTGTAQAPIDLARMTPPHLELIALLSKYRTP